ncbi:MAG: Rne/Rng family ribonuclease [Pelagimonas sp.]|jgi:ribonuclease E|nr:Rne/Rng family ribonuclease [Pelagimonas sp.]
MAKKMLIDATHAEETRVVVVDGNKVEEFDFESENKRQLAGNIYLAKVTRVEPSLQAAFVDYGGNRHGFLAFSEIHPDYYQIPVADRQALMEEEAALAAADDEDEKEAPKKRSRTRSRKPRGGEKAAADVTEDTAAKAPRDSSEISGMETIDLDDEGGEDTEAGAPGEGLSPMETVQDTPIDEPVDAADATAEPSETPQEAATDAAPEAEETPAPEAQAEGEAVAEAAPEELHSEDATTAVEAAPEEAASAEVEVASQEVDAEDAASDEDKPSRPMAASSDDDAKIVTSDPVAPAEEDAPAPDEAPAAEPEAVAETVPAEVVEETPEVAETAEPEAGAAAETQPEATPAEAPAADTAAPESVAAEGETAEPVAQEPAASEPAEVQEETQDAAEPVDAAPKTEDTPAETADAQPAEASESAAEETTSEVTPDEASEDTPEEAKETKPKRSRKSRKKSSAAERDETIESVADDDTEEDIRPARKPRPRRYKIQEVIKVRQIMLVQVVKEERGNKGAALTTYLSLAGRYCVLMPNTARGGGISRKITNASDRSKLKAIAGEIDVPKGAGLIIRTAGAKRTKTEIKRDYEYLQRLWEQIRELTLKSIAPAKIYEEGDLIKRSIRDLYSREIDEVLVEGEEGYRTAKDFMKMIMPSHAKNVQHYNEQMPLFARYQVESYLGGMFNPTVQLKSGGYIVIGVTEALVAIDVNSGRATKEGSIEETALKTNLEAAEEVARQLRLRDLAGLIVIDFIDMDERKNNTAVEKRLKDKLKTDRARIQVGRISGFGLLEMSRQRLRPGMIEATTQPCPHCHGTGLIRSDDNMALQVLRQIEEEGTRRRTREVLVKCPVGIANYLMNQKREHIAQIEARYGMAVRIEGDPHLVAPDFSMEKFKTATRNVPVVEAPVVSVDTKLMEQLDEEAAAEEADELEAQDAAPAPAEDEDDKPKKKRRRRRRRSKSKEGEGTDAADEAETSGADADAGSDDGTDAKSEEGEETPEAEEKPKKNRSRNRSRSRSRSRSKDAEGEADSAAEAPVETPEAQPADADTPPAEAPQDAVSEDVSETPVTDTAETPAEEAAEETVSETPEAPAEESTAQEVVSLAEEAPTDQSEAEPQDGKRKRTRMKASDMIAQVMANVETDEVAAPAEEDAPATEEAPAAEETPVVEEAVAAPEEEAPKPKKRGWWSLGR